MHAHPSYASSKHSLNAMVNIKYPISLDDSYMYMYAVGLALHRDVHYEHFITDAGRALIIRDG